MAGRPLRRLREAAMMNPLVGWEDLSGLTARQALEPDVPLVAAGAKAKYAEVYTRVGLPLAVVLHPPKKKFGHAAGGEAQRNSPVDEAQEEEGLSSLFPAGTAAGESRQDFANDSVCLAAPIGR